MIDEAFFGLPRGWDMIIVILTTFSPYLHR